MSHCRFCETPLSTTFVDLGMSPFSNSYRSRDQLQKVEKFYPLHAYVCKSCKLVQLEEFETPDEIFSNYHYFSSMSESWLSHASKYADTMTSRFELNADSFVCEVASNDGYLLQYFHKKNIPVLGIEPAANVAEVARRNDVRTETCFFGTDSARQIKEKFRAADVIAANNVLAHVPNIKDFVLGFTELLKPNGVVTVEFPHLAQLVAKNQFDTIYHEHFSYLSLFVVRDIFASVGLRVFDVEELPTHGGSLRIFACHESSSAHPILPAVSRILEQEIAHGLQTMDYYQGFSRKAERVKRELLKFLIEARESNKSVVGYGAPAKGNTLLNYCGIRTDLLEYTVDRSDYKQNLFLPGSGIPIFAPERIAQTHPDFVLILPWNIKEEIESQMAGIREWGAKFVVAIPSLKIW